MLAVTAMSCAALWLYRLVRGVDLTPVQPRTIPRSISASKRFSPLKSAASPALAKFVEVICEEMVARVAEDTAKLQRRPGKLTLYFRATTGLARTRVVHTPSFTDAR